jgi:hypothetical protein
VARLARRHGTSRKFVRAQRERAREAIDVAFAEPPAAPLVETFPRVSETWVRRFALAVILIVHGSYRQVVELLRDLFGLSLSIGTIHSWVEQAAQPNDQPRAGSVGVRKACTTRSSGQPAGACRHRCRLDLLLSAAGRQSSATPTPGACTCWTLPSKGSIPTTRWPTRARGCRAGQVAAWGDKPCHGDVFHVRQPSAGGVTNVLTRLAKGSASRREALELEMSAAKDGGDGRQLSARLGRARQAEVQARHLAADVASLTGWLGHDVLSLAGPHVEERRELFDFIVAQLRLREALAAHRIRPLRVALQRQRDDVLGFARVLDGKLASIAQRRNMPLYWVRQVCRWHRKKPTSAYWQQRSTRGWARGSWPSSPTCVDLDDTPRSSSMVENLNSRLRRYFFLRRHLGDAYLSLLQFFLNHRAFMRSRRVERVGKTPKQLLTGQVPAHWLELLGFERLGRA